MDLASPLARRPFTEISAAEVLDNLRRIERSKAGFNSCVVVADLCFYTGFSTGATDTRTQGNRAVESIVRPA